MAARSPRFRLTPPQVSETSLQEQVAKTLDVLLMPPAFWCAYPSGHIQLPPAAGAALLRCGLKRGIPDLLVFYGGRTYGIELKLPGRHLSKDRFVRSKRSGALRFVAGQSSVHPLLQAAGMQIDIAHDVGEVLALLDRWQIPTRVARGAAAA
jgi:hypothetical protein